MEAEVLNAPVPLLGLHCDYAIRRRLFLRSSIEYLDIGTSNWDARAREITVTVVGVNSKEEIDYYHPCQVTWTVVGIPNPQALPYGCEWRLESYWTTCVPFGK